MKDVIGVGDIVDYKDDETDCPAVRSGRGEVVSEVEPFEEPHLFEVMIENGSTEFYWESELTVVHEFDDEIKPYRFDPSAVLIIWLFSCLCWLLLVLHP